VPRARARARARGSQTQEELPQKCPPAPVLPLWRGPVPPPALSSPHHVLLPTSSARVPQVKTKRRANIGSASAIASDVLWTAVIFCAKRNKERKRSERWKYYLPSGHASRREAKRGTRARSRSLWIFRPRTERAHASRLTIGRDCVRQERRGGGGGGESGASATWSRFAIASSPKNNHYRMNPDVARTVLTATPNELVGAPISPSRSERERTLVHETFEP